MSARVWFPLLLLALGVAADAGAQVCLPPRCQDVAVPLPPGVSVPENTVRVLLPQGYDPLGPGYPVIYLLHGVGDSYRTWTENTDVVAFSAAYPVIIVMPDGGAGSEAGWYSDWQDGSRQWETFHTQVLVDFVDQALNTLGPGHRGVMGLSMGGFGAMKYAARHPGLFLAAASFSGAVDTQYAAPASGVFFENLNEAFGTPDDRVWGDQLTDAETWSAHNPTARAGDLACTELYVATGTGTPGGPAGDDPGNPGGYGLEAFIFQMNLSFAAALTQQGVPFHNDFYAGGYHGWPYWQRELHWALPQMVPQLQSGTGVCPAGAAPDLLSVMTYNVLHGQPCNGGSVGSEVRPRMELAVQGGPNREPGLVELAPDILGMQEVSQVFVEQTTAENLVCLAGSTPEGLDGIEPYEHATHFLTRRMNGVAEMRDVEDGVASSTTPTSASPYASRFVRDNPRVLPLVPDPPVGVDDQTLSDLAAELGNFEIGLTTLSKHRIQRVTVHNLSFGAQPGETRALSHATVRDASGRAFDLFNSHLTTTGGDSPQTLLMAANIIEFIGQNRRHPETPAFFVCDCNATPDSQTHALFETAGFVDSFALANPGVDGFSSGRDGLSLSCDEAVGSRIDYVWAIPDDQGRVPQVLSSFVVMEYRQQFSADTCRYPSDHNGVITSFDLSSFE